MQTVNIHEQRYTELAYSVQNIINNSLAVLALKVDESKEELMPYVPAAERQRVADHFAQMKQEQQLIHSAFNTLMNLGRDGEREIVQSAVDLRQPEEILMDHLRSMQTLREA